MNKKEIFHSVADLTSTIEKLKKKPTYEVGQFLQNFSNEEILELLEHFSPEHKGLLWAELPLVRQLELSKKISKKKLGEIFEYIPSESRADLFQLFMQEEQAALLPYLNKNVREDVISLSAYPPETAGGIMSTDFATVRKEMTCQEAIEKVRLDAPSKKTIYYIYVVDDQQHLVGFVTLKDIILAHPSTKVENVLHDEFVFAFVDEDREAVAQLIENYDLVAIPILNRSKQLVGIVTHDNAIDIIRAEHSEDMQKFMGILQANEAFDYNATSSFKHFRKRVVWIVSLAAIGILSGIIIHSHEQALTKLLILALYMPMVADTGGNAGSQAATVVVRALALGQIQVNHWWKILWKETKISTLLSICLGVLAFAKVIFLSWETEVPTEFSLIEIAFVISLALSIQVISATVIGAGLPLLVKKLGGDPAVAASPAITTIVDITGLLIYFTTAQIFLNI